MMKYFRIIYVVVPKNSYKQLKENVKLVLEEELKNTFR